MEASLWSATGQDSSPCRSIARQKGQSETLVNSHATATGEQKGQRPGACATSVESVAAGASLSRVNHSHRRQLYWPDE